MGLDTVEIILRTEETFGVDLPDDECGRVQTVGDLYRLVLDKLKLPYIPTKEIENPENSATAGRDFSRRTLSALTTWTTEDVWVTLKALIEDQLQVDAEDVRESASFLNDLGCD